MLLGEPVEQCVCVCQGRSLLADIITSSTGYSDFALKLVGALREAVELDLEGADEREVRGEYATLQSHSSRSGACAVGQAARPRGQGVVSTGRLGNTSRLAASTLRYSVRLLSRSLPGAIAVSLSFALSNFCSVLVHVPYEDLRALWCTTGCYDWEESRGSPRRQGAAAAGAPESGPSQGAGAGVGEEVAG